MFDLCCLLFWYILCDLHSKIPNVSMQFSVLRSKCKSSISEQKIICLNIADNVRNAGRLFDSSRDLKTSLKALNIFFFQFWRNKKLSYSIKTRYQDKSIKTLNSKMLKQYQLTLTVNSEEITFRSSSGVSCNSAKNNSKLNTFGRGKMQCPRSSLCSKFFLKLLNSRSCSRQFKLLNASLICFL